MIEIAKLEKTFAAETAADKWWDGLSKKEQQAYIKAHPRSKYAKKGGASNKSGETKSESMHGVTTYAKHDADDKAIRGLVKKHGGEIQGEGGLREEDNYDIYSHIPKKNLKAFRSDLRSAKIKHDWHGETDGSW